MKPTGFLAVSFPRLAESIDLHPTKCLCPRNHSHVIAVGKDENGKYKTAPLKQYPQPLCAFVAGSFHRQFNDMGIGVFDLSWLIANISKEAARFFFPSDRYCEEQVWDNFCHDCAP